MLIKVTPHTQKYHPIPKQIITSYSKKLTFISFSFSISLSWQLIDLFFSCFSQCSFAKQKHPICIRTKIVYWDIGFWIFGIVYLYCIGFWVLEFWHWCLVCGIGVLVYYWDIGFWVLGFVVVALFYYFIVVVVC